MGLTVQFSFCFHRSCRALAFVAVILIAAASLNGERCFASSIQFSNLSESDLQGVVTDFGATFAHTSVSPASQLGEFFGVEIGLIGGVAKTPNVKRLVDATSPGSNISYLPTASALLGLSIPMGLKFELEVLPLVTGYNVGLKKMSYAIQWNLTDSVLPLPLDLAIKFHSSSVEATYSQSVNSVVEDADITESIYGFDLIVSKSFILVEPYLALGIVQAFGTLEMSGGANSVFAFTNNLSASTSNKSMEALAGANLHLAHFNLGLEGGYLFSTTRALLKLSASF